MQISVDTEYSIAKNAAGLIKINGFVETVFASASRAPLISDSRPAGFRGICLHQIEGRFLGPFFRNERSRRARFLTPRRAEHRRE